MLFSDTESVPSSTKGTATPKKTAFGEDEEWQIVPCSQPDDDEHLDDHHPSATDPRADATADHGCRTKAEVRGRHNVPPSHGAGPSASPRARNVGTTAPHARLKTLCAQEKPKMGLCVSQQLCQHRIHDGCYGLVCSRDGAYVEQDDSDWPCTMCRPTSDAAEASG